MTKLSTCEANAGRPWIKSCNHAAKYALYGVSATITGGCRTSRGQSWLLCGVHTPQFVRAALPSGGTYNAFTS